MTRVKVYAGACRYRAVIKVSKIDKTKISVHVASGCSQLTAMNPELAELDWRGGLFRSYGESPVFQAAAKHIHHLDCPIPAAIMKAISVELGLALPVGAEISFPGVPASVDDEVEEVSSPS